MYNIYLQPVVEWKENVAEIPQNATVLESIEDT